MDRLTRFKILRALWARAKALLAWLHGPREREERLRAFRWHQINSAERQIRDGLIRGTGDPDSSIRPQAPERGGPSLDRGPVQADSAWRAQLEAQREWYAAQQRRAHERRGR